MTTRSARSSLVGPPTTVTEVDSLAEEMPYEDINSNWNNDINLSHEFGSNDPANNLVQISPPIEQVISTFNDELDSLTRTFDDLLSHQRTVNSFTTTTPRGVDTAVPFPFSNYPSTVKKKTESFHEKDPPPSAQRLSPLRTYMNNSTPAKRSGTSPSYTPAEPPPRPVETPGFAYPTPNRRRRPHTSSTSIGEESYSTGRYSRREPPSVTTRSRLEPREIHMTPLHEKEEGRQDSNGYEDSVVQRLRILVREQQKIIRDLEDENDLLRKKLLSQPPSVERVHRSYNGTTPHQGPYLHENDQENSYHTTPTRDKDMHHSSHRRQPRSDMHRREEPMGRRQTPIPTNTQRERSSQSASSPNHRSNYPSGVVPPSATPAPTPNRKLTTTTRDGRQPPPRHLQSLAEVIEEVGEAFTPGTRFVAELATLMKVEQGHHAPLSVILDKHWDKLKQHFRDD